MTIRLATAVVGAGLALLVFLGTVAASWQEIRTRRDFRVFPATGRAVPVDGGMVHLHCMGMGQPTVVVTSGTGVLSLQWSRIQRQLAAAGVRVCVWDRRGLAWSRSTPNTRAVETAEDLFNALRTAGETGPYILVGESYGGYVARLFRQAHRDEVTGIVLVESAHPRQWEAIPGARELLQSARMKLLIGVWLSRFGLLRWTTQDSGADLPEDVRPALIAFQAHTATVRTVLAEIDGVLDSAREVLSTPRLDSLPLVVLSAGRSFDRFLPNAPPFQLKAMNEAWLALQNDLCTLSTNCVHLLEPTATHNISRERPDVVVGAIRRAVETVRRDLSARS